MWLFYLLFSLILQIWYVEVRISWSVSESTLDFEITRVDCVSIRRVSQSSPSHCQLLSLSLSASLSQTRTHARTDEHTHAQKTGITVCQKQLIKYASLTITDIAISPC